MQVVKNWQTDFTFAFTQRILLPLWGSFSNALNLNRVAPICLLANRFSNFADGLLKTSCRRGYRMRQFCFWLVVAVGLDDWIGKNKGKKKQLIKKIALNKSIKHTMCYRKSSITHTYICIALITSSVQEVHPNQLNSSKCTVMQCIAFKYFCIRHFLPISPLL